MPFAERRTIGPARQTQAAEKSHRVRRARSSLVISAIVVHDLQCVFELRPEELFGIDRDLCFLPWIFVGIDSFLYRGIQVVADAEAVFDENLTQRFNTDTF